MFTSTQLPMRLTTTRAPLQTVGNQMTYYGSIVLLTFGITGCIFNFITFTAPKLRKNSCAVYFLVAAVFELFALTFGLISRVASENLGSTLMTTSTVYCKIRAYLVSVIPLTATYLVVLSSADRCMSSSIHASLRSFSRVKIAHRATMIAIIISFTSCVHILVGYSSRPRCSSTSGTYAMFDSMFVVFWLGVIPHALMLVFGFVTLLNIRRTKRRVAVQPTAVGTAPDQRTRRTRKKDIQLIMMMLVQVGLSTLLIMTRMSYYAHYTLSPPVTVNDRAFASFMSSLTILLYYANYAKSFYVYTLSSHLFRSIFVQRVKSLLRLRVRRRTPTAPIENTTCVARVGGAQPNA